MKKKTAQWKWLQWKWDTRFKFCEAFWVWTKTNIGDVSNSSSDDEEGADYQVKRISNSEWCECSAKAVAGWCSSK